MVVSMRSYKPEDVERVRNITRPYIETHGEPIAWVSPDFLHGNRLRALMKMIGFQSCQGDRHY